MGRFFNHKTVLISFLTLSLGLFGFSYLWVDMGLILMLSATRPELLFLDNLRIWGINHRETLTQTYLGAILLLSLLQISLLKKEFSKISLRTIFIFSGLITLLYSLFYNFLSHDLFYYLFFAKATLLYNIDPYLITARQFGSQDLWVTFMHSTDIPYPYGWGFLSYSLLPALTFGANHFLPVFYGLKLLNALLFWGTGWLLWKTLGDKKVFGFWFFNPFLLIELLANAHNDLLMICLFIVSVVFLYQRKKVYSGMVFFGSLLTKSSSYFLTPSIIGLPVILLKENWRLLYFRLISIALFVFLQFTNKAVLPWYYTWFYMFLPFASLKVKSWVLVFLGGLLLEVNTASYLNTGDWNRPFITSLDLWLWVIFLLILYGELNLRFHTFLSPRLNFLKRDKTASN